MQNKTIHVQIYDNQIQNVTFKLRNSTIKMSEDRFSVEEHFDNHSRSMSHKDFKYFKSIIASGVKFYFREMGVSGNANTSTNKAKFDKFIKNADDKFRESSLRKKGIFIKRKKDSSRVIYFSKS
ncbi:MAG: hypothetical protein OIF36_03480 [Alphaproteobacteria bacterium]|nr:hypothetical protein [Alphaproteobacteria bacterium]